jgi:hypothetical protein
MPGRSIVEISAGELRPGRLSELFRAGALAVILVDDPRVSELWSAFVPSPESGADAARQAWESGVFDLARNHSRGDLECGDMLRFVPGGYGHFARKLVVFSDPHSGELKSIPEGFWTQGRRIAPDPRALGTAWQLMAEVVAGLSPSGLGRPYELRIEQLKYPASPEELEQVTALLADAAGRWTQLGQRLDAAKALAAGAFDRKGLRDLFGWSSLVPALRRFLDPLNARLRRSGSKDVPEGSRMIGRPHVDRSKFLSALASDRDTICTEVYDGHRWLELPLRRDALALLPCSKLEAALGIAPTVHRVLQLGVGENGAKRVNATLGLAVVEPHVVSESR